MAERERGSFVTAGVILAATLAAVLLWHSRSALVDQAFVSLQCAHNWSLGIGLRFNAVEPGVACPHLVHAAVSAIAAGRSSDVLLLRLLSLLAFAVTVLLTTRLDNSLQRRTGWYLTTLALIGTLPAVAFWAINPAEIMFATALFTAGIAAGMSELRHGWRASALLLLLAACDRPELALPILVWRLVIRWRQSTAQAWRDDLILIVGFGAFCLWRWSSLATPLLSSIALQRALSEGFPLIEQSFAAWSRAYPLLAAVVVWPLIALLQREQWREGRWLEGLALYLTAWSAWKILLLGADPGLPHFAFAVPALPLFVILLMSMLRASKAPALAIIALAVLQSLWALRAVDDVAINRGTQISERARALAEPRLLSTPTADLIATNAPGALAYFGGYRTVGLLDGGPLLTAPPDFPKPRSHLEAALAWRPDSIIEFSPSLTATVGEAPLERALLDHPIFRFFYALRPPSASAGPSLIDDGTRYFDFDQIDRSFWPVAWQQLRPAVHANEHRTDEDAVSDIVDAAARHWKSLRQGPPLEHAEEPPEQAELQHQLELARGAIEGGDVTRAKQILAEVLERNQTLCSPEIGTGAGMLSLLCRDITRTVQGYKQGLRCDPIDANEMKERHLRTMLRFDPAELPQPGS